MNKKIITGTIILFLISSACLFAKPKSKNKEPAQQAPIEEKHEWVDLLSFVENATTAISKQSFAVVGMSRYSNYDSMPSYYKTLSDALDAYSTSLVATNLLATLYVDSVTKEFKLEWGGKYGFQKASDEQTAIKNVIEDEEFKNSEDEALKKIVARAKLGLAENLVLLSQSYIDFINAVNNAENQFYDENLKPGIVVSDYSARVVTKEEQMEILNLLGSVKNKQYNSVLQALITVSYKALDSINSDVVLPISRDDVKKLVVD